MHSNLDLLKREIVESLQSEDFAVFFGLARPGEELPNIYWDTEHYPDYQNFIAVAKKLGVKLVLLSEREFAAEDVEQVLEDIEDCDFSPEERRKIERHLRDFRMYEGRTCALRLTIHYDNRPYVLDLRTDWFQDFLETSDEVAERLPDEEEDDDHSLGGLYSNN